RGVNEYVGSVVQRRHALGSDRANEIDVVELKFTRELPKITTLASIAGNDQTGFSNLRLDRCECSQRARNVVVRLQIAIRQQHRLQRAALAKLKARRIYGVEHRLRLHSESGKDLYQII